MDQMLRFEIETLVKEKIDKFFLENNCYQSSDTKEIDAAFAQALSEYPIIKANKKNSFHLGEFADFDAIMTPIRPILAKHGLGLSQYTVIDSTGARVLHTRLRHSSGQWMETRERLIPEKNDDHTYASTLMYKKRHQAMALLNITLVNDIYDDDGEFAMNEARRQFIKGTQLNSDYDPKNELQLTIDIHQYEDLIREVDEYTEIIDQILTSYKIQSLRDLPKTKYGSVIQKIREIKEVRAGRRKL